MNCHIRSLLFVSALTLMLVCGFAYFAPGDRLTAVAAQSTPPTGSFGYVINFGVTRGSTDSGAAFLGVFNFDGAGNLTGSYTAQLGPTERRPAVTGTGTLTGTYSSNPDGTGTLTAALDAGLTFTFATVIADGGQSLQLAATGCSGGCNIAGDVISGIARSAYTGPLKGSFGFHLDSSPEPGTVIGVVNFDGSGNAAASFTAVAAGHDPSQAAGDERNPRGHLLHESRWQRHAHAFRCIRSACRNIRFCDDRRRFGSLTPANGHDGEQRSVRNCPAPVERG